MISSVQIHPHQRRYTQSKNISRRLLSANTPDTLRFGKTTADKPPELSPLDEKLFSTLLVMNTTQELSEILKHTKKRSFFGLKQGLNINAIYMGKTPLQMAILMNSAGLAEPILAHPELDINAQNPFGDTALHTAIWGGNPRIIEALLEMPNLDINVQGDFKRTPLMLAAEHGDFDTAQALLAHPEIDLEKRNKWGQTALDVARERKWPDIEALILNKLANQSFS